MIALQLFLSFHLCDSIICRYFQKELLSPCLLSPEFIDEVRIDYLLLSYLKQTHQLLFCSLSPCQLLQITAIINRQSKKIIYIKVKQSLQYLSALEAIKINSSLKKKKRKKRGLIEQDCPPLEKKTMLCCLCKLLLQHIAVVCFLFFLKR